MKPPIRAEQEVCTAPVMSGRSCGAWPGGWQVKWLALAELRHFGFLQPQMDRMDADKEDEG